MTRLTKAQRRALEWLPSDGSWRLHEKGAPAAAIYSLKLCHPGSAEYEYGNYGPRGGWHQRYRLTAAGMKLKAEMETGE